MEKKTFELEKENMNTFKPADITERIKTFEDACRELGEEHYLVKVYRGLVVGSDGQTFSMGDADRYVGYFEPQDGQPLLLEDSAEGGVL